MPSLSFFLKNILITLLMVGITLPYTLGQKDSNQRNIRLLPNRFEPGYLLTVEGDSIEGMIWPQGKFAAQKKLRFYDYYGGRTHYNPADIVGYGYDSIHYRAFPMPVQFAGILADSMIFLQRVVKGPASLYRFFTRSSILTFQRGPSYYDLLVLPDGTRHEISYVFRWKRLADYLSEHPTLPAGIRDGTYQPKDTPELIRQYNQWLAEQPRSPTARR